MDLTTLVTRRCMIVVSALAACLWMCTGMAWATPPQYYIVHESGFPVGNPKTNLNNNGQVVLFSNALGLVLATFNPSGGWTFVPIAEPPGTLFHQYFISGLDDAGRISGAATFAHPSCPQQGPNLERAFIRDVGGGYAFYSDDGENDEQNYVAVHISPGGQVVSSACMNVNCGNGNPCGGGIGNYWRGTSSGMDMTLFPVPAGVTFQSMKAVDDAGLVLLKPPHALWRDGQLFPIPTGITGEVMDINNIGQAIAIGPDFTGRLWSDFNGNHVVDAGELTALVTPPGWFIPTAFNDHGVIIGQAGPSPPLTPHVWVAGQAYKLGDLVPGSPTTINSAVDINNDGWILASVTGASGTNLAMLVPAPDTDGDGLLDDWEINGIPYVDSNNATQRYILNDDGDPQSDSLPNHKDIWVEIDAMQGRAPTDADLQRVKDAFALAPASLVNNPNSQAGVRLHAIIDETNLPLFAFPNSFTQFDQVKLTQQSSPATTINGRFGTVAERTGPDALAKREAKRKAFRYCIFADTHSGGLSSGSSELPGNDFMVTLGGWPIALTGVYKAGAFMHELGHTLGLGHGGRDTVTGADHSVYKPNYYSIMNYTWQMPEQWMDPNTWPLAPGRFGYSTFALLDLNEADLFECQGVGAPVGVFNSCSVPHNTHNSTFLSVAAFTSYMCCAIDWNNNGNVGCFSDPVAVDLNHLYDNNPASPGEVLRGREDWSKLVYDFRTSPDFADGVHLTAALVEEITFEEHQAVLASLPAFCLGDINLDRSVNVDDLLAVITAWGAAGNSVADVNGDGTVNVDDLLAVITNWGPCR